MSALERTASNGAARKAAILLSILAEDEGPRRSCAICRRATWKRVTEEVANLAASADRK